MNIIKIELHNFRNYNNYKIDKFSKLNLIIGHNGVGKTSILESIYFCSLTKTFKSSDDLTMIKNGSDALKAKVTVYDDLVNKNLEVLLSKKGKKTKINDFPQKKLSDFISQYKVIILSPDELKIIKSSPNIRRNYFNIQISQLHKDYINYLNNYNLLIKNKNEYLKKLMLNRTLDTKYLDIIDEKQAEIGLKIYNYRNNYIKEINKNINNYFINFNKKSHVEIKYVSDFFSNNLHDIIKLLKRNRIKDINLGMSTIGVHRDDYEFLQDKNNSKEYSSQGTQKLIVLSMKLSEIDVFVNVYNIEPIILLDDLFSELDIVNKNKIFKCLKKDLQIFITTTDIKNIDKKILKNSKIYNLDERI